MTARWREHLPYAALLLAGAVARCAGLGARPLAASEAAASWLAWSLAAGGSPADGVLVPVPESGSLLGLQVALFWFFPGGDAAARFLPAIVGSLVVIVPWALRSALGRVESITLAALLATDPLFIGYSRLADGTALGVAAVWTAVICGWALVTPCGAIARSRITQAAWIALAIGAVSGRVFWDMLPPLLALSAMFRAGGAEATQPRRRTLILAAVAAIFVASSGLTQWSGLQFWSVGVTGWLRQWSDPSGVALSELWATLIRFEMAAMTLGAAGLMAALFRSRLPRFGARLLVCAAWGALLTLRPGRTPAAWFALQLPLFLAAASMAPILGEGIARLVARRRSLGAVAAGAAVLLVLQVAGAATRITTDARPHRFRPYADETLPPVRALVVDLRDWSAQQGAGNLTGAIEIASPHDIDAVLAWYLRDRSEVRWVGALSAESPARNERRIELVTNPTSSRDTATYPLRQYGSTVLLAGVR